MDLVAIGVFFLFWIAVIAGWVKIAKITGVIIATVMALGLVVAIITNFNNLLALLGAGALIWVVVAIIDSFGRGTTSDYGR